MPCNSDHMEPRFSEKESKLAAQLIVYVGKQTGLIPAVAIVKAAKDCYGDESRLNDLTVMLCKLCSEMGTDDVDRIIYNGRNPTARKLDDWWEKHQNADVDRCVKGMV